MIQRLRISNYRSLGENVSVDFGRFTALVGPNGSGKSNIVDALRFVSDAMHMGLSGAITHRHGIGAVRRWSGGHPYNFSIRLDLALDDSTTAYYSFELRGDSAEEYKVKSEEALIFGGEETIRFKVESGKWAEGPAGLTPPLDDKSLALSIIGGDARLQPLVHALQRISVYAIFPDTLRAPQKYNPVKPMDRYGSNWASILKDQPRATWKPDLISALQKLTGDTEDIKVSQAASYLVVQFRHTSPNKKPKWFDAAQESDGTLRVAGIVTALLQEPPVPVIGIEEPELTVHPGAIPLLYDFLKEASRRSQVLVTTHSPDLLELMDASDVRVVLRNQDGTTVAPMASEQREAVRQGLLTVGEILRTEGLQQELSFASAG
ncbi:MAG TPA: AAA family ATPase [Thermoanaerobaculia bacterium]|nr:AAA family ATPase [Thermoanaerobaculia bacterium]